LSEKLLYTIISGTVGKESATAYLSFRKVMNKLPNIGLLLDGEDQEFSHDNQLLFALIIGIVSHLKSDGSSQKIDNAIKLSFTLPPEFSVMLIKDLQQNGIDIESSSKWESWVEKFAYLLL
jgi:hypothetical protein